MKGYKRFKDYSDKEKTLLLLKGYTVSDHWEAEYWSLNDQYHREDGPAIIRNNGDVSWYLNGKLHRLDGPAVIYSNGTKYWHVNGERHRLDGPAFVGATGSTGYYLNGAVYSEEEYNEKIKQLQKI